MGRGRPISDNSAGGNGYIVIKRGSKTGWLLKSPIRTHIESCFMEDSDIPNDLMHLLSGSRKTRKAVLRRLRELPAVVVYLREYAHQNKEPLPIHIEVFLRPLGERNKPDTTAPRIGGCGYTCCAAESPLADNVHRFRSALAHGGPISRAAWAATFDAFGRYYDPISGYWESSSALFRDSDTGDWGPAYEDNDEAEAQTACDPPHEWSEKQCPEDDDPMAGSYDSDVPPSYVGPVAISYRSSLGQSKSVVFRDLAQAEQAAGFAVRFDLGGYNEVALSCAPGAKADFQNAESWMFDLDEDEEDACRDRTFPEYAGGFPLWRITSLCANSFPSVSGEPGVIYIGLNASVDARSTQEVVIRGLSKNQVHESEAYMTGEWRSWSAMPTWMLVAARLATPGPAMLDHIEGAFDRGSDGAGRYTPEQRSPT